MSVHCHLYISCGPVSFNWLAVLCHLLVSDCKKKIAFTQTNVRLKPNQFISEIRMSKLFV